MDIEALAGRIEIQDIDRYQLTVPPWEVRLRQLSHGQFCASVDYIVVNDILLYREHWSHTVLATGATPAGYFVFGGAASPGTLGSWTWTGACIGENSCVITMSEPKTANVDFKCDLIQIEDNTQVEWECYQLEVIDESAFVIDADDDVTFRAEHSVILGHGFTVKENGTLRVVMTGY